MKKTDEIIFGIDGNNKKVTYSQMRDLRDDDLRLLLLKKRLDLFLVNQIDAMKGVYCPFPLGIMVCTSIETLGQLSVTSENNFQKTPFVEVFKKFDKEYSTVFSKKDKESISDIWKIRELKNINCFADLFYTYYRNKMMHYYKGVGIFLNDTTGFKWEFSNSIIEINPYWLWERYKEIYSATFKTILDKHTSPNPVRQQSLMYLNELLFYNDIKD